MKSSFQRKDYFMKYTKFGDIPQFTRDASYHVNMGYS